MGGRGSGSGKVQEIKASFTLNNEYYSANTKTEQKMVDGAVQDMQNTINDIINDSWIGFDINNPYAEDTLYEALANDYSGMIGNDAEKIVDTRNGRVVTVSVDARIRDGKLNVELRPHNYSQDEFTDSELDDMGIYRS